MKCPHCLVEFHDNVGVIQIGQDLEGKYEIKSRNCPSCNKLIFHLNQYTDEDRVVNSTWKTVRTFENEILIRPKTANRPPIPLEVPEQYANDYKEACLVFSDSPKASAALSRRCLQHIIRNKLSITKKDLFQEIQEVIDNGILPTDILDSIDSVRNVGNFAAHPIKSTSTGEIVDVEPHEADWNLDVLEMLFEYLFVRPEAIKRKRTALNSKLSDAGKNPMK